MGFRQRSFIFLVVIAMICLVECLEEDQSTTKENAGEKGSIVRSCAVHPRDRVNCGWPRIKEEVCENRGCCYSEEYKNSFWCFYPRTDFTPASVKKVMKCVTRCAKLSWRRTVLIGAVCQTNVACWRIKESLVGATCTSLCKTNTSFESFIGNVSSCLRVSDESLNQTRFQCNSNVGCWINKYGRKAQRCSEEYARRLDGRTPTTVPTDLEHIGQIAQHAGTEIQMPRNRPAVPAEPDQSNLTWLLEPDPDILRTHVDIEKSVLQPVEDLTEDEEPNPWWEEGARA